MRYLLLSCLFFFIISCKEKAKNTTESLKQEKITFTPEGNLQIFRKDSSLISLNIELAETAYETETGLMYRESMEADQGMLFIFEDEQPHNFYMKNTYIPLDLFFITKDQKIATIIEDAKPLDESSLPSEVPVQYVLEVNAGSAAAWEIKEGDSISWKRD
ncbi:MULTISPECIES: DUF192 domain-containing protein [unclassified Leeuwenhoekiella]|uniref:DUF192 domain-containing protein n=1 Tax=unclassified Leeuwenhoekiella TaxID=2615029 RepID=UPI000C411A54|nr:MULTISPECIES: DUF192 domain-containing protein [unclassified Leeuwenhoekiella]MAW95714.1 hypothetical protein [Leeuwenhoekiella sp.]MBA81212.1 hypothetical protein [Leeuwenhoekiella sp.]|tara:strand:+ start:8123 stop:8602 length:480 start_codon:yes stop_codon:yes gene_type:complete